MEGRETNKKVSESSNPWKAKAPEDFTDLDAPSRIMHKDMEPAQNWVEWVWRGWAVVALHILS